MECSRISAGTPARSTRPRTRTGSPCIAATCACTAAMSPPPPAITSSTSGTSRATRSNDSSSVKMPLRRMTLARNSTEGRGGGTGRGGKRDRSMPCGTSKMWSRWRAGSAIREIASGAQMSRPAARDCCSRARASSTHCLPAVSQAPRPGRAVGRAVPPRHERAEHQRRPYAEQRQAQPGEHRVHLVHQIEGDVAAEPLEQQPHPHHEGQPIERRVVAGRHQHVQVERRRQRRADVDPLRRDVDMVAALGQPPHEAERDQPVAVRQVIGEQLRRVGDEDGQRPRQARGHLAPPLARSRAIELTRAPR